MEKFYKINSAKRLDGADNYGNVTDSIYFEGEKDSALYRHAPTTDVSEGKEIYGIIETLPTKAGGEYRKFTKKQVPEEGVDQPQVSQSPSSAPRPASNNGDGMRQGMSINNAAKYVIESAVKDSITLSPQELADEIKRYALEIYNIDLTVTVTPSQEDRILDIMSQ